MTSIINNSNANSSLVNSLNDSESKMVPDVYSTKRLYIQQQLVAMLELTYLAEQ